MQASKPKYQSITVNHETLKEVFCKVMKMKPLCRSALDSRG